jgi:hypothetical protein
MDAILWVIILAPLILVLYTAFVKPLLLFVLCLAALVIYTVFSLPGGPDDDGW